MKFATVLIISVEAFLLLVKAHHLDFTSKNLLEKDVEQNTLKKKDSQDSREVKLFASMYSDGFDRVLEGSFMIWGRDKNYKCSYAKVYFKDETALGVKLGLVLKTPGHFIDENYTEAFLRKIDDKWFVVERKPFWEFVRKIFDLNYADRTYETDEEFDTMEPNLGIARPPLLKPKNRVESNPKPNFHPEVSRDYQEDPDENDLEDVVFVSPPRDEAEEANPMVELDNIPNPQKPKKDLGEGNPLVEVDKTKGTSKDSSTIEVEEGVKKAETPKDNPEEKEIRLRKGVKDKSVVAKEKKDGEKSSFLTTSLLIPVLMMLYTFK